MGIGRVGLRGLLAVPMLAAALAIGSPAPAAAAYSCTGDVTGGTIRESIAVPAGATCSLFNVVVRGGVTVGTGATFESYDSDIRGPVSGTGVDTVQINDGAVRGSVTIAGASGSVNVISAEVRGDVVLTGVADYAFVGGASVRGGVTLNNNTELLVTDNTIDGGLACSGNGSVTNQGNPNTVGGAKTGQCAGL